MTYVFHIPAGTTAANPAQQRWHAGHWRGLNKSGQSNAGVAGENTQRTDIPVPPALIRIRLWNVWNSGLSELGSTRELDLWI